jgi:hypothetical protein
VVAASLLMARAERLRREQAAQPFKG